MAISVKMLFEILILCGIINGYICQGQGKMSNY